MNKKSRRLRLLFLFRKEMKNNMSDRERLKELNEQIAKLNKQLAPLIEERKALKQKMKKENYESMPYHPNAGRYCITKKGTYAVYWNYRDKTYYCKPLYKINGRPMGMKVSYEQVMRRMEKWKESDYTEVMSITHD